LLRVGRKNGEKTGRNFALFFASLAFYQKSAPIANIFSKFSQKKRFYRAARSTRPSKRDFSFRRYRRPRASKFAGRRFSLRLIYRTSSLPNLTLDAVRLYRFETHVLLYCIKNVKNGVKTLKN